MIVLAPLSFFRLLKTGLTFHKTGKLHSSIFIYLSNEKCFFLKHNRSIRQRGKILQSLSDSISRATEKLIGFANGCGVRKWLQIALV